MKNRKIVLNEIEFILGKEYEDVVLGNRGMAIAGISYHTRCDQLLITWNDSTNRPVEQWIDIVNIKAVKVKVPPGGPAPTFNTLNK